MTQGKSMHPSNTNLGSSAVTHLLTELRRRDVRLWVEEDRLRFRALEGAVTQQLLEQMRLHKSAIITFIRQATIHEAIAPIPQADREQPLPLTFAQERLWFQEQIHDVEQAAYHMSATLHLYGPLDLDALTASFNTVIARHEILRTTFPIHSEQPVQQIAATAPVDLRVVELPLCEGISVNPLPATARELIVTEATHPFDLAQGPLVRVLVIRLQREDAAAPDHLLTVTLHHLVADGWSVQLFIGEIAGVYAALVGGTQPQLPVLTTQYADFAQWQRHRLHGEALESAYAYWETQLVGAPALLELPTDYARQAVQVTRGARYMSTIDAALTARLRDLSQQQGATLFMTLAAAFNVLLARYSGQSDIVIGTPTANRDHPAIEPLIGFFVNTVLLRTQLADNPTFIDLLARVRQTAVDAYAHQELPYIKLVERLQPVRNLSYNPLYQVMFALDEGETPLPTLSGLTVTPVETDLVTAEDDLFLQVTVEPSGLTLRWEYNASLFAPETISRLATHFAELLQAIVAQPTLPVQVMPLLTRHERQQLLVEWNRTDYAFDTSKAYHELFEEQVAKTPDALAVLYREQRLTYRELNALADRLATHFAAHIATQSIGSHTGESANLVALLCDRSPLFLAAVLGLFKVGAAYLPLDVRAPAARQAQVLGQSRTPLLLITGDYADLAAESLAELPADEQPKVLDLDMLISETGHDTRETSHAGPHEVHITREPLGHASPLAYVIYTSGSTGLPKGAMVEQQGMINHLYAKIEDLRLTAADTVAQTAPQSFDISVWQFLSTLIIGGQVHIFPDEVAADPVALLEQSAAEEITILEVVPSLLRMMVDALADGVGVDLSKLRWMIPTGEALPPNLARQWLHHCPQIPLVNAYGPTECSDDVTHYIISEPPAATVVNMPIGRPILNMRMYILDTSMQPVPIGVAGELYVGGIGVGRGYLRDPERTAAAFVPDPFSADPNARLYKTGDKARYLADGNIEYLGRLDYQVKIRGFRIELGEIEAVLEQHPALYQAIVIDQSDPMGNKRLVAYIVANGGTVGRWDNGTVGQWDSETVQPSDRPTVPLPQTLRTYLSAHLPDYMIPAAFVELDALPLTPNGKVDRKALAAIELDLWGTQERYVPPETPLQAALVTLWADILKLQADTVGVEHNFFELGGHSLLGVQIIARVRRDFQIELPIRTLMENPTIAGMAAAMQSRLLLQQLSDTDATAISSAIAVDHTRKSAIAADHTREVFDL